MQVARCELPSIFRPFDRLRATQLSASLLSFDCFPSTRYPSTRFAAQEPRCSGTTRSGQSSGRRSGTDGMRVVPSLSCSILDILSFKFKVQSFKFQVSSCGFQVSSFRLPSTAILRLLRAQETRAQAPTGCGFQVSSSRRCTERSRSVSGFKFQHSSFIVSFQ